MAVKTEGVHTGSFLASEASGWRSRESIVVLSGQVLLAGAILGRADRAVGRAAIPAVVGTGNGVMSGVFVGPDVIKGNYVITLITAASDGGIFSVVNPKGIALDNATVGTPYVSSEVNFTIADGGTDFAVSAVFTLVIGTGTPAVVGTGNGIVSSIALGTEAKPGRYRLRCIAVASDGGTFQLVDPDGDVIATQAIPSTFTTSQLTVTVADGSTDYVIGDFFEFVVYNELANKYAAWNPVGITGVQNVAGILYGDVDATAGDTKGVAIVRDAEVNEHELLWATGVSAGEKAALKDNLAALGIITRS